jgi:hypothetical protein
MIAASALNATNRIACQHYSWWQVRKIVYFWLKDTPTKDFSVFFVLVFTLANCMCRLEFMFKILLTLVSKYAFL